MAASTGLLQRGLQSLRSNVQGLRTGEGDSQGAKFTRAGKKGLKKAKGGFGGLKVALGFTEAVDGYEEESDEERSRKRRTRALLGQEEMLFVAKDGAQSRDMSATIAPEFRGQVASGLAAANSMTAGSTMADAPTLRDD